MKLSKYQEDVAVSIAGYVDEEISSYVCGKNRLQMETAFEKKMLSDWKTTHDSMISRLDRGGGCIFDFMSENEFYGQRIRDFVFNYAYPIAKNIIQLRLTAEVVTNEVLTSEEELLTEICLEIVGEKINNIERPKETFIDSFLKGYGYSKKWPKMFRETIPIEKIGLYWMKNKN